MNRNTGYHYINIWLALRSISVTWEWVINLNRLNDKGHQKQNITELRQMTQPLSIKLMNRKRKDADIEKERFIEEKPTNPLSPLVKKKEWFSMMRGNDLTNWLFSHFFDLFFLVADVRKSANNNRNTNKRYIENRYLNRKKIFFY